MPCMSNVPIGDSMEMHTGEFASDGVDDPQQCTPRRYALLALATVVFIYRMSNEKFL